MEKTGNDPTFYNQLAGAQKNGPVLQFLNNLDVQVMERPADYSAKKWHRSKNAISNGLNRSIKLA